MDDWRVLLERATELQRAIEDALHEHEAAFRGDAACGTARALVADDLGLDWQGGVLRSLWLVSHRGLRRAGFRQHADSDAVLVGWRGDGLVLLRPPGERRSLELVAHDRPDGRSGHRCVAVPRRTLYDTLADAAAWHLLVFQSHAAAGLTRSEPHEDGWTDILEAP